MTEQNNILFPIIKRVFAKTIAQDLVEVKPMNAESEEEKIKRENKIRVDKIKSIIENKEFKKTNDHIPKEVGCELFYLDYKYKSPDKD